MQRNNPNHIKSVWYQSPRYSCAAQSNELCQMLGLAPKQKLPVEGMEPRLIQGILVWVNPLPEVKLDWRGRPQRRFTLRVRARCPQCEKEFAASRLIQHTCK